MTRHKQQAQQTLWEGILLEDVKALWEPWMVEADKLLEDEELIERVYEAQGERQDPHCAKRKETSEFAPKDPSYGDTKDPSYKESHTQENHVKRVVDADYAPANRKNHDSQARVSPQPSTCKEYPQLRSALARYMWEEGDSELVVPTDRTVVDIIDASGHATEAEVIECLNYLYEERGLRPGTKHGPRTFAWFLTVVQDYFSRRRLRDGVANPCEYHEGAGLYEARERASIRF